MRKCLLILLFAIGLGSLYANPEKLYADANQAHRDGNYKEAILLFEQLITEHNLIAPELYYNLGNAYYKLTDYPNAILNYERALKLKPGDEDVKFNLGLANQKIEDRIEPVPQIFYVTWFKTVRNLIALDTWSILFLSLLALSAITWGVYFLHTRRSARVAGFYSGISLLVLAIVSLCLAFSLNKDSRIQQDAIVFSSSVSVKSSPSDAGTGIFVLHAGTKVSIHDRLGDWVKVRVADGNEGWMQIGELEII